MVQKYYGTDLSIPSGENKLLRADTEEVFDDSDLQDIFDEMELDRWEMLEKNVVECDY